jgi:hypothetical protein
MFRIHYILALVMLFHINSLASYEYDDSALGNISLSAGIWNTNLNGDISNNKSTNISFKNDLNFKDDKTINILSADLKNDIFWLPDFQINYFTLTNSSNALLKTPQTIDTKTISGNISTNVVYTNVDAIIYGYLYQGPFEFDLGLKFKKINFTHTIDELDINSGYDKVVINGPTNLIILPHIGLKIDIPDINTLLKVQVSMFSIGDIEAKDYEYSINYRIMRNMYLSYAYRYHSWRSVSDNDIYEKYNIILDGNYFSAKILF